MMQQLTLNVTANVTRAFDVGGYRFGRVVSMPNGATLTIQTTAKNGVTSPPISYVPGRRLRVGESPIERVILLCSVTGNVVIQFSNLDEMIDDWNPDATGTNGGMTARTYSRATSVNAVSVQNLTASLGTEVGCLATTSTWVRAIVTLKDSAPGPILLGETSGTQGVYLHPGQSAELYAPHGSAGGFSTIKTYNLQVVAVSLSILVEYF